MDEKSLIFLEHILQNIAKIEKFTKSLSKEDLINDELKQYAVIRAIEIIGEAVKNIDRHFMEQHEDIPWKKIIGSRDKMFHHYFGVDFNIIWNIIKVDLPDLKYKLEKIIKNN